MTLEQVNLMDVILPMMHLFQKFFVELENNNDNNKKISGAVIGRGRTYNN